MSIGGNYWHDLVLAGSNPRLKLTKSELAWTSENHADELPACCSYAFVRMQTQLQCESHPQ